MPTYRGDPRWTKAYYDSICAKCKKKIKRGEKIFYYPNTRSVLCDAENCGIDAYADFQSHVFDEAMETYIPWG